MTEPAEGVPAAADPEAEPSRVRPVEPGHLPVSEFAFDRAGAGSPFGDDVTLPLPVEDLTYRHPED